MKFMPDLTFSGNCLEALEYYKEIFKGEVIQIITYEDAVVSCKKDDYDKIFSAVLIVGKNTIYFSDELYLEESQTEGKFAIMIEFYNEAEMNDIFLKISKDGKVLQEIIETNWGSLYGSVKDKFGFVWNLNYEICII